MSRTGGLPGFHESEWEPSAVISLVLLAALDVLIYESFRGPQVVWLYVILVLFQGAFCLLLLRFSFYRKGRASVSQP